MKRNSAAMVVLLVVGMLLTACGEESLSPWDITTKAGHEKACEQKDKVVKSLVSLQYGEPSSERDAALADWGFPVKSEDMDKDGKLDTAFNRQVNSAKSKLVNADGCKSTSASAPSSSDVNKQAGMWVEQIVLNFRGVTSTPKECRDWTPDVDLTKVHYYHKSTNKESDTAFGPAMGTTPCEIAINMVERTYRDPMLLVDKAKRRGLIEFRPENQAQKVSYYADAPFAERRKLAEKVLGWYANGKRELTIAHYKGGYRSNVVSIASDGTPVTRNVRSTKASDVLVATNRKTGKVESYDRMNCGDQDFVPDRPVPPPPNDNPPPNPPPSNPPPTTPPCVAKPDDGTKECEPKDPTQDPGPQGNAPTGGGKNEDSGPGVKNPKPTFAPTYSSPSTAPEPTKTPRPEPPPPAESEAPQPSEPETTCYPAPGKSSC